MVRHHHRLHRRPPTAIPRAMAVIERYAGPEYKHQEMGQPNLSTEHRERVVRWWR